MIHTVNLMVCHRTLSGRESGKCDALEIVDCEVLSLREVDIRFERNQGAIRLGRKEFPVLSWTPYAGNILWDKFTVTTETAARIANHIRSWARTHSVSCFEAETSLWNKWETRQRFTAADFDRFVSEVEPSELIPEV